MANQKLTELPSASLPLGNSDLFYIVQQGTTTTPESFSITFHNLATSIVSGGGGSVLFQVNGVDVTDQTTINFVQSSNMTVTNPSAGTISFASGGGGGSGGAL